MKPIAIGRIRTSHGVTGAVKVESYSGETDHFYSLESVDLRKGDHLRRLEIEQIREHGTTILMKFRGIDAPETAKTLAGYEIVVDRAHAAPLKEGEFYQSDLIGLAVMCDGNVVGNVRSTYDGPQGILLEVETPDGIRLVPLLEAFVGDVDITSGSVALIGDWILE